MSSKNFSGAIGDEKAYPGVNKEPLSKDEMVKNDHIDLVSPGGIPGQQIIGSSAKKWK